MSLLLLGGTGDARHLATELFTAMLSRNNVNVIYSVAGLVRKPQVPCEVVSGGFSQYSTLDDNEVGNNGLENYIREKNITEILDVTHPYAERMSSTAVSIAAKCKIPYWRYHRPEWKKQQGDNWQVFKNWDELLPRLLDKSNVFFSVGQIPSDVLSELDDMLDESKQGHILRTAVEPKMVLGPRVQWIKAIGPFEFEDEISLLKKYKVDVIVTKNSGGDATVAKLDAARELKIPVLMLSRPELPQADKVFTNHESCKQFVIDHYEKQS